MKRVAVILAIIHLSITGFGQIIVDHTVVDKYEQIPQHYIDSVKKMLVWVAGMSHSIGYQVGVDLLGSLDSRFPASTWMTDPPPSYSGQYIRLGRPAMSSAGVWSSEYWRENHLNIIDNQSSAGNPYSVFLYSWCYDMTWHNAPGGTVDPEHNVRWAGDSEFGTGSYYRWGLDSGDEELTGNEICMDTYLASIEYMLAQANLNSHPTVVVFTTGPVDGNSGTENGFQRELKHDYIRSYVSEDMTRILFDYADILCWNDEGEQYISEWSDNGNIRSHAQIHPDNLQDIDGIDPSGEYTDDHIGEVGALRLGKAMWWMLARIAGWNGVLTRVEETSDVELPSRYRVYDNEILIDVNPANIFNNVSLISLNGRLISTKKITGSTCRINTTNLPAGVYVVSLTNKTITETRRIVIK